MTEQLLKVISVEQATQDAKRQDPVDPDSLLKARSILDQIKLRKDAALREFAVQFGDLKEGDKLLLGHSELKAAYEGLDAKTRGLLDRTALRIRTFAQAQLAAISETQISIDGGLAGHNVTPVEAAGCYAPGGRYPLPSSVLMTAVTARVAGVRKVYVASPRPTQVTQAAAFVAGADGLLAVGGAQAIAAFAYGTETIPAMDAVVGPGNKYVRTTLVTAAKQLVAGRVAIDTLAGPSECLVVADDTADASIVAADLLAQAEHDDDARAILVATSASIVDAVNGELAKQLSTLSTAATARNALKNSFAVVVKSVEAAIKVSDWIAPEHLEVHVRNAYEYKKSFNHYGAMFISSGSAEVLGDYGAGPNHVLPTRGAARSSGGLSVFTFLRIRTWLQIDDLPECQQVVTDSVALARIEGLEGHARAAEKRLLESPAETVAAAAASASSPATTTSTTPSSIPKPLAEKVASENVLQLAIPKGRMEEELFSLLNEAGIKVTVSARGYRPVISLPGVEVKMLNPRNVTGMLHNGSRDVGFSGSDLVNELNAHLELMLDTGLSPVKIVVAVPEAFLVNGELPKLGRPLLVATEYTNLTQKWITGKGIDAKVVSSRGATEVFPPEDADFIVDNTATGSTLKANKLHIIDTLMTSSTGFWANPSALKNPHKKRIIDHMVTLMKSVLAARTNLMLEFHVPADRLDSMISVLPAMKRPTVAKLADENLFSIKIVVKKESFGDILHLIKDHGGSDIIVTKPVYVVP